MEKLDGLWWMAELFDGSFTLNLGGFAIVSYVLSAWAMYAIAKRRGFSSPGLAWVPVANVWIMGDLSDRYRLFAKGEKKNKRKWLLGLTIATGVLVAALIVWIIVLMIVVGFGTVPSEPDTVEEAIEGLLPEMLGTLLVGVPILLALAGVVIATAVLSWMATWDILRSCDPKNAQKYFLIGILTSLVGINGFDAAFLFAVKDKDEGMIPKQPEIQSEIEN